MALIPIWLQNVDYSARYDRQLFSMLFGGVERVISGLVVSQHGAGDLSVDVSIGSAVINGDDQANQGMYPVLLDAVENVVMPAAPGSNSRIDVVYLRINDPNAGGPAGDDAEFGVEQGVAALSPSVPATPTSAIALARVLRTAGEGSVLTAAITDVAPRAQFPFGYGTSAPSGVGIPGHLFVQYT